MPEEMKNYRGAEWFGLNGKECFLHRSWMRNQGFPNDVFDGRPIIGICNTWLELSPCNAHLRAPDDRVKNGIWEAGGFPLEANHGADFDFLVGCRGTAVAREPH